MTHNSTRRRFLTTAAAVAGAPAIVPASALGKEGKPAAGDRITLGCIGVGNRGSANLNGLMADERVEVVAICDVDTNYRNRALKKAKLPDSAGYNDFRKVIEREDIDAVMIATPDHWHAIITAAAARAGKDIFCEKPLTHSVAEGRYISDLVREKNRVLQSGTWRRSRGACRTVCELALNGHLGKIHTIDVGVVEGVRPRHDMDGTEPTQPVPDGFDYDRWLGPAPKAPYSPARTHFNFRWILDYSGGYITDWGVHFADVAQWGNGTDHTGPTHIAPASETEFCQQGIWDVPTKFNVAYTYPNGVKMNLFSTSEQRKWGVTFVGERGSAHVNTGTFTVDPREIKRTAIGPDKVPLYPSKNHYRNFIDCVLSRETPAAPVETAHRSATVCNLGLISLLTNRPLEWDPETEQFKNDPDANQMLTKPHRSPWTL